MEMLKKAGFQQVDFQKICFPTIRMDLDKTRKKWKAVANKYLPRWQIETKLVAMS